MSLPDRPVLIVDDDVNMRSGLAELLKLRRFPVVTAANGEEALVQAREHKPCVILLDLMMPLMNGEQFRAAQMQDDSIREIPIIVFSGKPDCAGVAKRLNAVSCLMKPIRLGQVVDEIAAYCASSTP
jgi:CheY-like chemotaxis protein